MKTLKYAILLTFIMLNTVSLIAQTEDNDSTLSRRVVVERDFQPVIQPAGKINAPLSQVQTKIDPVPVTYSDYSQPLANVFNLHTLTANGLRFHSPDENHGWLEVAGGYPLTRLDFGYHLTEKNDIRMNLYARHNAQWGARTWSESNVGMDFVKRFSTLDVYFDVDGKNTFFTRYGRYYDGDKHLRKTYADMRRADKQHLWDVRANVGVRSRATESVLYRVQTGYATFVMPSLVAEHLIRTHADVAWQNDENKAGVKLFVQNVFYSLDRSMNLDSLDVRSRHAIRIEPFYEYSATRWRVHAGVNIDMNFGRGKILSANDNVSFAPSPNVQIEYRIIPSWLAVYADAKGSLGTGTLQAFMQENPYRVPMAGVVDRHPCPYTPVDAGVGFRIKPANTLYLEVYARYAHLRNQMTLFSPTQTQLLASDDTYLDYLYSRYNRWTVGVELIYHYQDIVHLHAAGHYYHWTQLDIENSDTTTYDVTTPYDRPAWDASLRVDANITKQWTIYSENRIEGSRKALLTDYSIVTLKPRIELNLGAEYHINRWMYVYAQLNNFIHRHNDLSYGYQTEGINGLVGFHWDF